MKQKVEVVAYHCDGCKKRRMASEVDGPPNGFHGTVTEVHEGGSTGEIEFYACSSRCIGKAATNAIARVQELNEAAESEPTTAPPLAEKMSEQDAADLAQAQVDQFDETLTTQDLADEKADLNEARGIPADEDADDWNLADAAK